MMSFGNLRVSEVIMKRIFLISFFTFLASCAFAISGFQEYFEDDPFAPVVEPPENIENREMWLRLIDRWEVPTIGKVGIPPYPDAYIVQVQEASAITVNNKVIKTLPTITLATVDQPEKVVNFYKEKLKGWNYSNDFMSRSFWKDDDRFDPLDLRKTSTTPNLIIYDIGEDMPEVLLPKARSRIKITYKPKKSPE